jgi:hypothetical protein
MREEMRRNWVCWSLAGLAVLCPATAQGESADALIRKLVDKGILTTQEASELKAEDEASPAPPPKTHAPEWVKNINLGGDFRARYDGIYQSGRSSIPDRDRFRYRLRIGANYKLSDAFEIGFRLGSGEVNNALTASGAGILGALGGSPFSNNSTFNGDGSKKFLFVDLAYASWKPRPWAQVEIGKMPNPFWMSDMLMDPDYTPEGSQERFRFEINEKQSIGASLGQYVIQENFGNGGGNANDVYLLINQLEWSAQWTPRWSSRLGGGAMNFAHQQDISSELERFIGQNGTSATGPGSVDFNPVIARGEVTYAFEEFPGYNGDFPLTLGAEYVNNPAADQDEAGYNLGVTLGSSRKKGNWQLSYNYKEIEASAVWHGINDDDFGFGAKGGTDVRGHQVIASYHLFNPLFLNLRYTRTEQINNAPGVKTGQDRVFMDLLWNF